MKGQGIVEYVLVLVLIAVVVICFLAVFGPLFSGVCGLGHSQFECSDSKVQECLKTEQYTKDQCVILVGGSK
jgi:hypothetical protein